jgi:hypothetical protein
MDQYRTISANNENLVEQVPATTNEYLDHAIGALDERFGVGFAKDNPGLVAAYVQACAVGLGTAFIARAVETFSVVVEPLVAKAMAAIEAEVEGRQQ